MAAVVEAAAAVVVAAVASVPVVAVVAQGTVEVPAGLQIEYNEKSELLYCS